MASSHYLVGKGGLSLQGFKKYIEPELERQGCTVPDRILMNPSINTGDEGNILISLVGEESLEEKLKLSIHQAESQVRAVESQKQRQDMEVWPHHVNFYREIGTYADDQTATDLFKTVSQGFLVQEVGRIVDEVDERLDDLSERLSS